MKKGLITTFYKAHNCGAMLQAYALKKVLNDKGYKIKFLNYRDLNIEESYKMFSLKNKNLKNKLKEILKILIFYKEIKNKNLNFENFQNEKLEETNYEISENNLTNVNKIKEDFIITGSDQVWNVDITKGLSDIYTLNFIKNINKISYAASIGTEKNVLKYKNEYIDKLTGINHISVREESAKNELEKILPSKNIQVVLDPTLLLSQNEWNEEIKTLKKEKERYILSYIVEGNEEQLKIVEYLSELTGLKVIHFERINRYKRVLRKANSDGPLEFVNLIKNADYIVATSFHATVFSIIFNKKFWIVPHKATGSRVTDLLKKLGISNRAVNTLEEFNNRNYDEEIDYEKVNKILEKEREKSINWLIDAIEK